MLRDISEEVFAEELGAVEWYFSGCVPSGDIVAGDACETVLGIQKCPHLGGRDEAESGEAVLERVENGPGLVSEDGLQRTDIGEDELALGLFSLPEEYRRVGSVGGEVRKGWKWIRKGMLLSEDFGVGSCREEGIVCQEASRIIVVRAGQAPLNDSFF